MDLRVLMLLLVTVSAQAVPPAPTVETPTGQYIFAWPFVDGNAMSPRGGMTRGRAVTLDREAGASWRALREPGLAPLERDRRAILAMAGEFRTSFDFIEIAGFTADYSPPRPYRSWGTEKVYVIEDSGRFISLQHVLVMRIQDDNGKESDPIVTKHWRQDWRYEPASVLVYRGHDSWEQQAVPVEARAGSWSQTVYQVDDSPRYGDIARWQHFGNYSSWASADGWRPLPRREFSVRDDYQVLVGSNRHTILPNGWVHEQQNNKVALGARGEPAPGTAVLARELGVNRYERILGYDFSAGDRYVESTAALWATVRAEWAALAARAGPIQLRGAPDKAQLFLPLFSYAAEISAATSPLDGSAMVARARALVRDYLREPGATARGSAD